MIRALSLSGLSVSRGERVLFRGLKLEMMAGEALALTGANGAGKTSLLRAVAGLLRPDAGDIAFHDADGNAIDPDAARSRETHLLGHLDGLKGARTVRQEMTFQSHWLGHSHSGLQHAVERLRLDPLLDLEVRKLSAGQRRRVALARLIGSPRSLWLLDEPLSPLDAAWRAEAGRIMAEHLEAGGLVMAAVHDPLPVPSRSLDLGGSAQITAP